MENLISERLKELRAINRLTQEQAAIKLGVARTTYSGYERGTSEPDFKVLEKMSSLFGVSIEWLINGNEGFDPTVEKMAEDILSLDEKDKKYILELIDRFKKERP